MAIPITKMKQARMRILVKNPFFASLMMSMPMICDPTLDPPTMATDMKTIWYHPQFEEENSVEVLEFGIVHEIMHAASEHGLRLGARDMFRWNVAADYVINPLLKDEGFEVWERALLKDEYRGMAAEHVYELLRQEEEANPPPPPQGGGGQGQPGQGQPQQGSGPPQSGQGNQKAPAAPGGQAQNHPMYQPGGRHESQMHHDVRRPEEGQDSVKEAALEREIRNKVAQAQSMAKMAGTLTDDLDRFCDKILNPKVPWQQVLREYMTSTSHNDENWNVRDRRIAGYFFPDTEEEAMGPTIEIGDASGSIGDDELGRYTTEGAVIAETMNPESVRLVWADTCVKGEQFFERGELVVPKPVGGGGTDMRVPLKHVEKYLPELVILFTDGYTPWPKGPPPYPLIVCCTTDHDVPAYLGQVVRI